ncbi:acetylornithine deacetylase [Actinoalloteichus sp. AHMU CJ021]|uniref:Acetylornithine deacetylase n=1 Tax=Actinoalloteichus caeruleus DSM 43889 TaxID=1120930 RepID=A0ABT1JDY9_ACTCY|nr:M20 family metallopeptidase [Actinoalloteichus caeruleus]AUS81331.1 acetylornithine deacetylase [Actinoalloteichus sp. AHMU CJ021]MCP2330713.1 acetylornithine deacetylase [Actinoalloteichus caeruleus DSM 43889]
MTDVVDLVSQLIRIPSVNPRGRAEPAETPLAEFVADWARRHGMTADLHEVLDGRYNVVVTVPGDSADTILLETHLDTVETEGMTVPPFEPTIRDGLLYGRGSCDAKGPLAVFLTAMAELAAGGPRPHTVTLAGVVDEEHIYRGVLALRDQGINPVGAVIGEPTSLRMVTAHKGCMRCRITARGPGGHSSEPWGKTNPITTAARIVDYLADEYAPALDAKARPLVGPPSLAVTMIDGGSGPNVLPESTTLTIDRRTVAGEDPHQVWGELRDELLRRWPEGVDVAEPHIVDYALETDPEDPFVRSVASVLAGAGHNPEAKGVGHGTDASKIALDGVPCVVFGPGAIAQAHTPAEFVPLDELHAARKVVGELLRSPVLDTKGAQAR